MPTSADASHLEERSTTIIASGQPVSGTLPHPTRNQTSGIGNSTPLLSEGFNGPRACSGTLRRRLRRGAGAPGLRAPMFLAASARPRLRLSQGRTRPRVRRRTTFPRSRSLRSNPGSDPLVCGLSSRSTDAEMIRVHHGASEHEPTVISPSQRCSGARTLDGPWRTMAPGSTRVALTKCTTVAVCSRSWLRCSNGRSRELSRVTDTFRGRYRRVFEDGLKVPMPMCRRSPRRHNVPDGGGSALSEAA